MAKKEQARKCLVTVRVRGTIRASHETRDTLNMLHLTRNNHAVLIDNRPSFLGMLKTAQNYVTWGEPSKEIIVSLLEKRGRLVGNERLTKEYLQKNGHQTFEDLAESIFQCRVEYWKMPDIKPFFRLRPPSKGFKGKVKKGYGAGGELGHRGERINGLLKRMI